MQNNILIYYHSSNWYIINISPHRYINILTSPKNDISIYQHFLKIMYRCVNISPNWYTSISTFSKNNISLYQKSPKRYINILKFAKKKSVYQYSPKVIFRYIKILHILILQIIYLYINSLQINISLYYKKISPPPPPPPPCQESRGRGGEGRRGGG